MIVEHVMYIYVYIFSFLTTYVGWRSSRRKSDIFTPTKNYAQVMSGTCRFRMWQVVGGGGVNVDIQNMQESKDGMYHSIKNRMWNYILMLLYVLYRVKLCEMTRTVCRLFMVFLRLHFARGT